MSEQSKWSEILVGKSPVEYGPRFQDHQFELYKIALQQAERISDRREKANAFFLSLCVAIMSGLGFLLDKVNEEYAIYTFAAVAFAAIPVCWCWIVTICSYRHLNGAKYKIIHALERDLPFRLFDAEWELLGRGENNRKYRPISHIETRIPKMFLLLLIFLILLMVWRQYEKAINIPQQAEFINVSTACILRVASRNSGI